jgi:hypothetical protein
VKEKDHFENPGLDGTILKWNLFNGIRWEDVGWINSVQDRQVAGCCEYGNETSGSIQRGEFGSRTTPSQNRLCYTYVTSHLNITLNAGSYVHRYKPCISEIQL